MRRADLEHRDGLGNLVPLSQLHAADSIDAGGQGQPLDFLDTGGTSSRLDNIFPTEGVHGQNVCQLLIKPDKLAEHPRLEG